MNEPDNISSGKLPPGTPKWVLVLCCLVGSVAVPLYVTTRPELSELIKGASEARKSQADNERTALGTVLEIVNTNTRQVAVLSEQLENEQREKKFLTARVAELEKTDALNSRAVKDCEVRLKICENK